MPQFSLKRMFVAVTLVAICVGEIVLIRHSPIDVAPAKHVFTGFGLVIVLSLLFWPAGGVANMPQFSLKRMFVAITLVAIGLADIAFLIRHAPIDLTCGANHLLYFTSLPFIFAGFLTPFKMTLRGFVMGFFLGLAIVVVLALMLPAVT